MNVFLIDADNLNSCAYVEEAFKALEQSEGDIPIRRAYGSPSNLKGLAKALKNLSIDPYVNLAIPKNTTDVALAVDAMELACQACPPKMVVIGSGDADFLPLVIRLKKKGIRMICITRKICASESILDDVLMAYDRVIMVGAKNSDSTIFQNDIKRAKTKFTPPEKEIIHSVGPNLIQQNQSKLKTKREKIEENKNKIIINSRKEYKIQQNSEIKGILRAAPSLASGLPQPMGIIVKILRDAGIIGKNSTAEKFFRRLKAYFEHPFGDRQVVRFIC